MNAPDAPVPDETNPWESWHPVDSRNGRRMSQATWPSRESLERDIEGWRERDRKGGRPDLHDKIPYLEARQDND